MEKDPEAAAAMRKASGQTAVPVIVAGEKVIVGFDQEELSKLKA